MRRRDLSGVKLLDVFRVVTNESFGAAMIAIEIIESDSQDEFQKLKIKTRLLNLNFTKFCKNCGAVLDSSSHPDICPECSGDMVDGIDTQSSRKLILSQIKSEYYTGVRH